MLGRVLALGFSSNVRPAKQVMKSHMRRPTSLPERPSNDAGQFIREAADLVTSAAKEQRTLHISQSFAGGRSTSATIVRLVTCPNDLVLEMQYAIDRAVRELLAERGSRPVTVQ
jgi:hypothetical protein